MRALIVITLAVIDSYGDDASDICLIQNDKDLHSLFSQQSKCPYITSFTDSSLSTTQPLSELVLQFLPDSQDLCSNEEVHRSSTEAPYSSAPAPPSSAPTSSKLALVSDGTNESRASLALSNESSPQVRDQDALIRVDSIAIEEPTESGTTPVLVEPASDEIVSLESIVTDLKPAKAEAPPTPSILPKVPMITSSAKASKEVKFLYDYSSSDAGGKIIEASRYIKNVRAIQKPNADLYMMSKCIDPTWVIIALPEQIYIQYVAFESRELFSSFFGKVAIMGSSEYPKNGWILLSIVELDQRKAREVFDLRPICEKLKRSSCWVTHLKLEVISFQPVPSSQFCTLTRFQAFGSTLLEGLHSKVTQGNVNKTTDSSRQQQGTELPEAALCPTEPPDALSVILRQQDPIWLERAFSNLQTPETQRPPRMTVQQEDVLDEESLSEEGSLIIADIPQDDSERGNSNVYTESTSVEKRLSAYRNGWLALLQERDHLVSPLAESTESFVESLSVKASDFLATSEERSIIPLAIESRSDTSPRQLIVQRTPDIPLWPGQTLSMSPDPPKMANSHNISRGVRRVPPKGRVTRFSILRNLIHRSLQSLSETEPTRTVEESPPLLALVDRVDHLEHNLLSQRNSTFTQFTILESLLAHSAAHSADYSDTKALLELVTEKAFWSQSLLNTLLSRSLLNRLLLVGCRHLLEEFSWGHANGKRQMCLASVLLQRLEVESKGLPSVIELQRLRRYIDDVAKVNIRTAVECRLRRLEYSLGESAGSGADDDSYSMSQQRLGYLEEVQEAADLYRTFLKSQVNWFGIRNIFQIFSYLIDSLETSLYNVCSILDVIVGSNALTDNTISQVYRAIKTSIDYFITALESDPMLTYLQIILLELPCIVTVNRILSCVLAVLVLDTALRTRDAELAIQDLQMERLLRPVESSDPEEEAGSLTSPKPIASPVRRKFKAASAPPSAARVGGGLSAALAHSLEPINRYWGRYTLKRARPTDSAASDSMEDMFPRESSDEDDDESPRVASSGPLRLATFTSPSPASELRQLTRPLATNSQGRRLSRLSARDGIRKLGETIVSLAGSSWESSRRRSRQPRLPRQAPTIFYSLLEPQTESLPHTPLPIPHSEPPYSLTDDLMSTHMHEHEKNN